VLGKYGIRTLVAEQKRYPVDKACGEGVMPVGVAHLKALGVRVEEDLRFDFRGIRYFSEDGRSASGDFREGPGWGIDRKVFSQALLQRAAAFPVVELCSNATGRLLGRESGRILAQMGDRRVSARLVIGADGINSHVRRWANLEQEVGRSLRWGARQHFQISPWSEYVEVYWGPGVEAYVTPVSADAVGIAFLWRRGGYKNIAGGSGLIPSLLAAFPTLQARLKDVPRRDEALAVGPLQRSTKAVIDDQIVLMGDAGGYLDAITGEGISLALAQAAALEETLVPLFHDSQAIFGTADLEAYAAVHRRIVAPYYVITGAVLWLGQHPGLVGPFLGLLRKYPALFQTLLSANMGILPRLPWRRRVATRAT